MMAVGEGWDGTANRISPDGSGWIEPKAANLSQRQRARGMRAESEVDETVRLDVDQTTWQM